MATSGTVSTTTFNTRRVVDRAFGRCKVQPQDITAERIEIAKDLLFLLLSTLGNKGILLWALDKVILPLYQGQAAVDLPLGTLNLLGMNLRSLTRLEGAYLSSDGGTVDFAFDDDFETVLTQTAPDGDVRVSFGTPTLVTTIGLLPGATGALDLVAETSDDLVTWTERLAIGAATYTDRVWAWYDIDGSLAASYLRVRETGGGTLVLRELFVGNNPSEIPIAALNQDDYINLPDKTAAGRPLQAWFDRQRGSATSLARLMTWQVCDQLNRYNQIVAYRQRYLQDVGTLAQEVEVPQRWYAYVVARLAADLSLELPEVPPQWTDRLMELANQAWQDVQNAETDDAPMTVGPSIGCYTK